ncbi:hypothetical protein ACP4OV_011041 [Aristida adscensionis]
MDGESRTTHNKLDIILQDQSSEQHSLPLEYLRKITNNFADEHLLGRGGFGSVYKGVPQNGDMIAVKKLTLTMPGTQDSQFANEVCHLMRLKHRNIVKLVGYCFETEDILIPYMGKYVYAEKSERLICLEYLPKRSLYEHLSDESSGLKWCTRYNIIEGICYGLHYLHEEPKVNTSITPYGKLNVPIIHMDLKPSNILLDDNMVPKIADFGLSRLFGEEQTRTCTINCRGTFGRKEYPYDIAKSSQEFIELVLEKWRSRHEKELEYSRQATDCQQIRRCIQIGLACVKHNWEERPTTFQVIELLRRAEAEEQLEIWCGPRTMQEDLTLNHIANHGFINSSWACSACAAGASTSSSARNRMVGRKTRPKRPATPQTMWRTGTLHKIYGEHLLDALLVMVAVGATQAWAVKQVADFALALTARGQTRWSRAIQLAGGAVDTKANAAATAASSAGRPRSIKVKVKLQLCVLRRLVPGCRKLSNNAALLEETADYVAALEMQVKTMRALADVLAAVQLSASSTAGDEEGLMIIGSDRIGSSTQPT